MVRPCTAHFGNPGVRHAASEDQEITIRKNALSNFVHIDKKILRGDANSHT